ncbi:MAG: energy-coupling factor ABC transporter ATP-binding protein [Desulfobacterota bacterium]|nr:energy-coupling factor ABC transporter ATP-binding protein [Thermodesulfobacteriota bacterium]MDW8001454.1 ABC transporter ATP-binding protein [Deltaproteobacteria bacterium]
MKEPLIRVRNVSFRYDSRPVLKDINFEVYEGDRIGLIGPNGSGKTTLLHIIMGLLKPEEGTLEILGKVREKEKDFLEVRQKIGLLFQNSDNQLFCPLVKEDVAFGPLNLGVPKREVDGIVDETLSMLGISYLKNRISARLSEGEKRLVALATIIAMKPICYMLDEPSAGLDEFYTEKVLRFLTENAKTYVVVSHDRTLIETVSNKVFVLREGVLLPQNLSVRKTTRLY